jgi:hypothetical protein
MSGRIPILAGERLVRVVDAQITCVVDAAYCWLLTHQLDRVAKRFRSAAAEIEEFAAERRGEAA